MSQASVWTPLYAAIGEPAARAHAAPGDVFPPDPQITASDAPNAAKLAAEGFVAVPATNWTTGQRMFVGPYAFNWNGTAWQAGTHAVLLAEQRNEDVPASYPLPHPQSEPEPETVIPEPDLEPEADAEPSVCEVVVDGTIPEVRAWVEENPEEVEAVLAAEEARSSPRTTLVTWLEDFIARRDEA